MTAAVALLTIPDSPLGAALAAAIVARDVPCHLLSIDAPLQGRPVTVRPGHVTWEGVELLEAGAVLVEQPVFPWPQPLRVEGLPTSPAAQQQRVTAEREARSLTAASLATVAEHRPVANPPECAHLAASPAMALQRAAQAGLHVQPWRLTAAPTEQPAGWWAMDAVGAERGHGSPPLQSGDRCLCLRIPDGPVQTQLVIAGRTIVATRWPDPSNPSAPAWGRPAPSARACPPDDGAAALAQRAISCLGLQFGAVTVALEAGVPRLLAVDAAPDLAAWDQMADGAVCPELAVQLIHLSTVAEGAAR